MLDILFFAGVVLYFFAMILQLIGASFKKEALLKYAWWLFLTGFAASTAYLVARGIAAGRVPMSNQFEFAAMFSWGIALMLIILKTRVKADWIVTAAIPMVFLIRMAVPIPMAVPILIVVLILTDFHLLYFARHLLLSLLIHYHRKDLHHPLTLLSLPSLVYGLLL